MLLSISEEQRELLQEQDERLASLCRKIDGVVIERDELMSLLLHYMDEEDIKSILYDCLLRHGFSEEYIQDNHGERCENWPSPNPAD